jgi:hypothetical protein
MAASGLAEPLACLGKDSWSESPSSASGRNDWQWHQFLAGGEWAPGKIAYAVGEAALVDEPPASESKDDGSRGVALCSTSHPRGQRRA